MLDYVGGSDVDIHGLLPGCAMWNHQGTRVAEKGRLRQFRDLLRFRDPVGILSSIQE